MLPLVKRKGRNCSVKTTVQFLLRQTVVLFCSGLFFLQVTEVYWDYVSEETSARISYEVNDKLDFPCLLFCASASYKPDFEDRLRHLEENYVKATFGLSELISDELDPEKWQVDEIRTYYMGRCFALKLKHPVSAVNTFVELHILRQIHALASEECESIWLKYSYFPFPIVRYALEMREEMGGADLHFSKRRNRVFKGCKKYSGGDFIDCITGEVKATLRSSPDACTSPLLKDLHMADLPLCISSEAASRSSKIVQEALVDLMNSANTSCPRPCDRSMFDATVNYFHRLNFPGVDNSSLAVRMYYDSLTVEVSEEYPIYDVPRLLASIGGSLGLFLGLSCLHILLCGIEKLGL